MGLTDWNEKEFARINNGLLLLGWRADERLTSDDGAFIEKIASEAIEHAAAGTLDSYAIDELAAKAFDVLRFQVMNIEERAMMVTGPYRESRFLASLVPMIDEAMLCLYRGYHTSALATLFIVLENYLRQLAGWKPGEPDPTFATLSGAVLNLPESGERDEAATIIAVVYSRYNSLSPPQFFFNRHGLLHGLRAPKIVDEMNCVRLLLLFDVLCFAEGIGREIIYEQEFYDRLAAYRCCSALSSEAQLIGRAD